MGKKNFLKHGLSQEKYKVHMKKSKKGWIAKGITLSSIFIIGLTSPVKMVSAVTEAATSNSDIVEQAKSTDVSDNANSDIVSEKTESSVNSKNEEASIKTESDATSNSITKTTIEGNSYKSVQKTEEKN